MESVVVSYVAFEWYEDSMLSGKIILFFYLITTIRKDTWVGTTSVTVMVVNFLSSYNNSAVMELIKSINALIY